MYTPWHALYHKLLNILIVLIVPTFLLTDISVSSLKLLCTILLFLMCSVAKLFPTLYNPKGCSPPGSSVHGTFQARILEWVAISFPRGYSPSRNQICITCIGRRILYHSASREAVIFHQVQKFL